MPIVRRAVFVVTTTLLHQVWHTDILGYSRGIFGCAGPYSPFGSEECGSWNRRFGGKYAVYGRQRIDCVELATNVSSRCLRNGHTLHAGNHSRLRLLSRDGGYVNPSRLPQIPGRRNDVTVLLVRQTPRLSLGAALGSDRSLETLHQHWTGIGVLCKLRLVTAAHPVPPSGRCTAVTLQPRFSQQTAGPSLPTNQLTASFSKLSSIVVVFWMRASLE